MEKLPVRIQVRSTQKLFEEAPILFSQEISGTLYTKSGAYYVTYTEPEEAGFGSTRTTWKISVTPECMTSLIRQGDVSMRQEFLFSQETSGTLVTPYGGFPLQVHTHRLHSTIGSDGGKLEIAYRMDMGGTISEMEVILEVIME